MRLNEKKRNETTDCRKSGLRAVKMRSTDPQITTLRKESSPFRERPRSKSSIPVGDFERTR